MASPPRRTPHLRPLILECLAASPGLTTQELAGRLGCNRSTLRHHLHQLQEENVVRLVAFKQRTRAFLATVDAARRDDIAILRRGRTLELALEVARSPGQPQAEILARLRLSRKTLRKYVQHLSDHGLLHQAHEHPFAVYYPSRRLLALVDEHRAHLASPTGG